MKQAPSWAPSHIREQRDTAKGKDDDKKKQDPLLAAGASSVTASVNYQLGLLIIVGR